MLGEDGLNQAGGRDVKRWIKGTDAKGRSLNAERTQHLSGWPLLDRNTLAGVNG